MTTEEIKCRLMEILCEAANDQRQPADTLDDMMESMKNLAQEMDRGGKRMTNFERWKSELTPGDLLRVDEKSSSSYKQSIFKSCSVCPAHRFCDEWYEEFIDVADMVGLGSCENLFNVWASEEAKEKSE